MLRGVPVFRTDKQFFEDAVGIFCSFLQFRPSNDGRDPTEKFKEVVADLQISKTISFVNLMFLVDNKIDFFRSRLGGIASEEAQRKAAQALRTLYADLRTVVDHEAPNPSHALSYVLDRCKQTKEYCEKLVPGPQPTNECPQIFEARLLRPSLGNEHASGTCSPNGRADTQLPPTPPQLPFRRNSEEVKTDDMRIKPTDMSPRDWRMAPTNVKEHIAALETQATPNREQAPPGIPCRRAENNQPVAGPPVRLEQYLEARERLRKAVGIRAEIPYGRGGEEPRVIEDEDIRRVSGGNTALSDKLRILLDNVDRRNLARSMDEFNTLLPNLVTDSPAASMQGPSRK